MEKTEEKVTIKITKPIKVTEFGPVKLKLDQEVEVSKSCGDVLISKGYGKKVEKKASKPEKISAEDAIKAIGEAKKVEDLKAFEDDKRATVIDALAAKKLELTEV